MANRIAYVSYDDKGQYTSNVENEDTKLFDFLKLKGLDVRPEIWSDPKVDWQSYDLVILKSPWDYFNRIKEFYNWINKLENESIRVLNPLSVVKWNSDKHYLNDIEKAGLPIIPTRFIEKGDKLELQQFFIEFKSKKIVVKPAISGGSKNTFALTAEEANEQADRINMLIQEESYMVQPFMTHIEQEGEWSFLYFNGNFSHALIKKAKPGDFRVQHYLGGTIHPQQPSVKLLKFIQQYVDQFAKNCLYARVDGIVTEEGFLLMELELIEPFLFLFTEEKSCENYYNALIELA